MWMAGLQEEQNHVIMATESDDEVEKISLGVRTKFQVCLNGAHNECGKNEGKKTKHFRPVNSDQVPKNLSVKPYFSSGRHGKCGGVVNKSISDSKMTLIVDDTRFVVDRNIFDSRPTTMLARCVWHFVGTVDVLDWSNLGGGGHKEDSLST